MRIACVHVPQFALQCLTRIDPALRSLAGRAAPVAIVGTSVDAGVGSAARLDPGAPRQQLLGSALGAGLHGPVVQACSRAAWSLGVRVGMTATAARALSAELRVLTADPQLERATIRAIADAMLGVSTIVDAGGRVGPGGVHLAMYCEVPSKTRGASFGERLLDLLDQLGVTGRIGIADDRFTAWVAASHGGDGRADDVPASHGGDGRADDVPAIARSIRSLPARGPSGAPSGSLGHAVAPGIGDVGVVSVPRGGSAAFLAPRPLSLLAISAEVQHMLEALGVRTLGQFAALPAPSVARPLEADYQALARGDSGHALRPYSPDAPIQEAATIRASRSGAAGHGGAPVAGGAGALSGPAAVAMVAARIALRLAGRGRGAARLEITIGGETGERVVTIVPRSTVLHAAEDVAEAIGGGVHDLGAAWRLRVVVTGEAVVGDPPIEHAADDGTFSAHPAIAAATHAELDPLSVVLSTSGSWHLTSPMLRAERRDAHRRTQRGKQRARQGSGRSSSPASGAPVQPRLFKNLV